MHIPIDEADEVVFVFSLNRGEFVVPRFRIDRPEEEQSTVQLGIVRGQVRLERKTILRVSVLEPSKKAGINRGIEESFRTAAHVRTKSEVVSVRRRCELGEQRSQARAISIVAFPSQGILEVLV
jgi:hypothetical protein